MCGCVCTSECVCDCVPLPLLPPGRPCPPVPTPTGSSRPWGAAAGRRGRCPSFGVLGSPRPRRARAPPVCATLRMVRFARNLWGRAAHPAGAHAEQLCRSHSPARGRHFRRRDPVGGGHSSCSGRRPPEQAVARGGPAFLVPLCSPAQLPGVTFGPRTHTGERKSRSPAVAGVPFPSLLREVDTHGAGDAASPVILRLSPGLTQRG